jgi:hypothetical protein
MAVRGARLFSALAAGGVLTGSLLLGGGTALAQSSPYPQPTPTGNTVPAQCGDAVTAMAGDRVLVTPALGLPFSQLASPGMDPITKSISGVFCQVDVSVVAPATTMVQQVAPEPLKSSVGSVTNGARAALRPAAPAPQLAPAPMAPQQMAPAAAPMPAMTPQQLSAAAPMFAPAFASLPASFLRDAMAPGLDMPAAAPAGRMMDPSLLFGSAFPGLRAGAPAYLGYDPASAVTTASQVQALPVDGLSSSSGIGLPVLIAVLVLAGVAAFAVRRSVIGSRTVAAAGAAPGVVPSLAEPTQPAAAPATGPQQAATDTGATPAATTAVTDVETTAVTDVEKTEVTATPVPAIA